MYYCQIYTIRNDKGNPSDRRQIIPEKLHLRRGMDKQIRNDNYVGKNMRF